MTDELDRLKPKLPERSRTRLLGGESRDRASREAEVQAIHRKYAKPAACVLLVDASGSMASDEKLDQARSGARQFASTATAARYLVALVSFSSATRVLAELTTDSRRIEAASRELHVEDTTDLASGLRAAAKILTDAYAPRAIVLFTDGFPNSAADAVEAANEIKARGIHIIARGTAPADLTFLQRIASADGLVEVVTVREIAAGIQSAARLLPPTPK